ncbi:hypothetical protein LTR49_026003 [Elasticomyces elasticus]|nr:hypothetical protein LTR49_026003 [Elasticomyces elasticus]
MLKLGTMAMRRVSDDSILHSLLEFHKALKARYGLKKNWPKLVVIALNQIHNTKFYPTEQESPVEVRSNVVVDRHITGYMMHECDLQAHTRAHGPAIPVRYVAIRDECDIPADALEAFTNSLHYNPTRLTKPTSVVVPVDYATLLCDRGRNNPFTTLVENSGARVPSFSATGNEWTGGVYTNLREVIWYMSILR